MNTVTTVVKPVVDLFRPQPKPVTISSWMSHRVSLICQLVWDAMGRLRAGTDGMDKSIKLAISGLQAGMLYYAGMETPRLQAISAHCWDVNGFFGAAGFFGRAQELTGFNEKTGGWLIKERPVFKASSIGFLTIGKGAELAKLFNKLELLPVAQLAAFDANYLGGIANRMGGTSIIRTLGLNSLGGTKNVFVILSATYAILDNVINLIDAKKWDAQTLAKIFLGVANDIGKIIMIMWFYWFTVTWSFVAVSSTVATIGISKILFDSYSATGKPNFLK
jgi:hypothetical protein